MFTLNERKVKVRKVFSCLYLKKKLILGATVLVIFFVVYINDKQNDKHWSRATLRGIVQIQAC